ncbi:hypothetical protein BGZ46_009820 [Entomortierella lignicola]|nr:hypothetical protein BGZ46_009820 [Entomortierella lignicola]
MDNNQGNGNFQRSPFRNLQPRAAAAISFNDSDDDDGSLSADYKAQRNTTKELVDFFKNAPPPPPPPSLPPIAAEEKKKRTLLQRLRSRKSSLTGKDFLSRSNVESSSVRGTSSSISANSRGEVATLPNGKKYIMIAVDYKSKGDEVVGGGGDTAPNAFPASTGRPLVLGSPKRLSANNPADNFVSKRASILNNNPNFQMTTRIQENSSNDENKGLSVGTDKRRSIVIQAGGGEGSTFVLDNTPFLLDNFALDTDYITASIGADQSQARQLPNGQFNSEANSGGHRRIHSARSGHSQQGVEYGSKRGTKVTFNIDGQQQQPEAMSEEALSKALADRIASHKAQIPNSISENTVIAITNDPSFQEPPKLPEILLPKPVSRKKVRHVQIQTQHCILRPMYTQTEPIESFSQEAKEFGTQTGAEGSIDGLTDVGTNTDSDSTAVTPTKLRPSLEVANLVASPGQQPSTKSTSTSTTIATSTAEGISLAISTTPLTSKEQEELIQLRKQNAALQAQVASLQRDLTAEIRARTRAAVAVQDIREKSELLSSMAYKKLKEMITNRHILEMEVRELRAQVDMQTEESDLYNQHGQQGYITVGLRY